MTTSPPDISSLSLSHRPSQQRLHDSYDYDATSANRQFHYATTQGLSQSPYNIAGMNQSPLKTKPVRGGLPQVFLLLRSLPMGTLGNVVAAMARQYAP